MRDAALAELNTTPDVLRAIRAKEEALGLVAAPEDTATAVAGKVPATRKFIFGRAKSLEALDMLVRAAQEKSDVTNRLLERLASGEIESLSRVELRRELVEIGVSVTLDDMDALFRFIDEDHSDSIEYLELFDVLSERQDVLPFADAAQEWVRQQAKRGNVRASFELAVWYLQGDSLIKDHARAVKWLRTAAKAGVADARCLLAYCLWNMGSIFSTFRSMPTANAEDLCRSEGT